MNVEFYGDIPVVTLSQFALDDSAWVVKRILDIIISCIALLLLSPLFLLIAAGIKLSSRGLYIDRQTRNWQNGSSTLILQIPIYAYKLRSLYAPGIRNQLDKKRKWSYAETRDSSFQDNG